MSSSSTKRVGNYEFLSRLGSGSYAQVYKVSKINTNEIFAIKAISKDKVTANI